MPRNKGKGKAGSSVAEKVPIISAEEFRAVAQAAVDKLGGEWFAGMRPHLEKILALLSEYHGYERFLVAQRHHALEEIVRECADWGATGDVKRRENKLIQKGKLLWASAIALLGYERKKGAELAHKIRMRPGRRQLSRGYQFEQLNKPGRLAVHTDALPSDPADMDDDMYSPTTADEAGLKLTGDEQTDYYAVKKFIKHYVSTGGRANLNYFDEAQRDHYRLEFSPRGVYRRGGIFNPPDPSTGGINNLTAYACSPAGEIYAAWQGELDPTTRMNHSTFMSGRPVKCAGVIVVEFGQLKSIDNNSGHYKPSLDDLQAVCQAILDKGYQPPDDCVARVMDFGGRHFPGLAETPLYEPMIQGPVISVPIEEYARDGIAAVRRYVPFAGARPAAAAPRHSFLARRAGGRGGAA